MQDLNQGKVKCSKGLVMWLIVVIQVLMISQVGCEGVYMTLTSSSQHVGTASTYSISFNRSLNTLGQTITPSSLQSNYQVAIIFDASYSISSSFSITLSNYTISANTATLFLSQPISNLTISIINPFPSQTALKITLNFYNASSPTSIIDTCSASLTFQALTFASSAMKYQFSPGNVSTQGNLTVTVVPYTWSPSKFGVELYFYTYWARNMLNVSANQALSTMSYCVPTCTITNMGNFYLVTFLSLALNATSISFTIYNIQSPATLELADTISISVVENTYGTDFQTGELAVSAAFSNNLQVLTATSTSLVGSQVTISVAMTTQDLFSSSDSIIIVLNTSVAMASQVTVTNILVASSSYTVQQNSIITVSSFQLVTNIPGQFSGSITITNISAQPSVKPVTGNKISFYRNGYLYDQSEFSFSVNQASISSIALTLASNQANANTNLTAAIMLSIGVGSTDILYVTIDQAIAVSTCNILSCANCSCSIKAANPSQGIFSTSLKVINFASTSSIIMFLGIKNPISSNYLLYFSTTDYSNFTKEVGSQTFPSIVQSVISSSVFSFSSTSSVVYQPSNFTLTLNFTAYTLLNGYMTITFDSAISLLNPSNKFCLVNGNNGACSLNIINGSIIANITISSNTPAYSITINNLRNPSSTQFFNFQVSIADSNNLPYYTLLSNNYQANNALTLTPQVSSSNCTNSASNIISITFPFLPFLPTSALVIDDPSAKSLQGESVLKKIVYPTPFSSNISLTSTNYYSLQPIYYHLLVVTNDSLYNIFSFNFTITNCNPNYLPIIQYSFTGLPQNSGTLTFTLNQVQVQTMNGINYLTLTFPSQYSNNITISSNAQLTSQLGPRYFNLSIGNTQPISLTIWGFTNVIGSSINIGAFSFSQAGSFVSYQIASNSNTVEYNLTALTNCTFPCKICSSSNNSACLQCYSSSTTQFYYYDPVALKCVAPSLCSSSTFPNATLTSCVSCPIQCSTCTSLTSCQSCAANYFLLNGTCLTNCPSGYYPINPSQICAPCDSSNNSAHCLTCITLNLCSTCLFPYYFDATSKTCVVSCSSSQIPLNGTCFACNSYCSTCQTSVLNCTSCVATYYLLQNSCIASCPSPYVPSTTTNICVNCSSSCLICTNTPTTCTSCQYPLKLFNSNCINDCPNGYYTYTASNNTLQCLSCLTQCALCSSLAICTSCISGLHLYSSSCLYSCPSSTFSQSVSNNNTVSLVCSPCSSNCVTCSSSTVCSQCQSSYYLTTTSNQTYCTSVCNVGEYLNGNVCQQCSSNCLSCLNSSICLMCTTSYSLQSSQCVSNCSTGSVSILNSVQLSSNNTAYTCKQCNQLYQDCSNCIASACTFCSSGYILNFDRTCVVICPTGYVNVSNTCVSCSTECKACVNIQSNCSSCNPNYTFYQNTTSQLNKCVVNCPAGTYNLSGICTSCVSPCLTCANSSNTCLTCMSGFYSFTNGTLNCVTSCPSNSYVFNSQCIFCNSLCSLCDANGCLSCFPQYYIHVGSVIGNKIYYDCFSSCPSNFPFLINNTCSQCTLNCQICSNTSCLQCDSAFYGYQQYCLKQCPPSMVPVSGICTLPMNNTTDNSTLVSSLTAASSNIVPVPFSISCIILILVILISKLAHSNTSISIAVFSHASFLAITCNIYYLVKTISSEPIKAFSVLLIIGLLINYINNIIFVFVSRHTLLKDSDFSCWKRGNVQLIKEERINPQPSHDNLQDQLNSDFTSQLNDNNVPKRFYTYECVWYMITTIGFFSSHNLYTLVFSQLFDLSIFKATVQTVKNLKILNYVWVVAILAHLTCLVSGIIEVAALSPSDPSYIQHVYKASDLIFVNSLCIILGLLLLKKKRQLWEKPRSKSVGDDVNSTKKVIFDHQSHEIDMNKDIENQSEVNGKIKNIFGTENGGSEHAIVGASYKSSTNQEGSDLYFEKEDGQNLDNSEEIKMENNIIWMQINPDQMMPQLVEKNESIVLEESQVQQVDKAKSTLNPDNNLDVFNFDKIQADEDKEEQQKEYEQKKSQNNTQKQSKIYDQEWQAAQNEYGDQQLPKDKESPQKEATSAHQNNNFIKIQQEYQQNLPQIDENAENSDKDGQQQSKVRADNATRMSQHHSSNNLTKSASSKRKMTNQLKSSEPLPKNIENPIIQLQVTQDNVDNNEKYEDNNDDEQLMKMEKNNEMPTQHAFVTLQAEAKVPINTNDIIDMLENASQEYNESPHFSPQSGQIHKREIKTKQGRMQRKQKDALSRQLPKIQDSNHKSLKQSHGNSAYYEQFNQFQSSPKAQQLQQFLSRQSIIVHNLEETHTNSQQNSQKSKSPSSIIKDHASKSPTREVRHFKQESPQRRRYKIASKYDPIKEQPNQLRMSNSTHNFANTQKTPHKQDISSHLYHNQDHSHIDASLNYNALPKSQQLSEGELLKKNFYKSINITKINNRLGSLEPQGRALSRDNQSPHSTLRTDRVTSLPKNNLTSFRLEDSRQSTFEKKQAWKSRTIHNGSRDNPNLSGTAKTIQKKARLAEVKAKLESIYLPPK